MDFNSAIRKSLILWTTLELASSNVTNSTEIIASLGNHLLEYFSNNKTPSVGALIEGLEEFFEIELKTVVQDGSIQDYSQWLVANYHNYLDGRPLMDLPKSVAGKAKVEVVVENGYSSNDSFDSDDEMDADDGIKGPVIDEDGFTLVQSRKKK
jgi:hypothetical protein